MKTTSSTSILTKLDAATILSCISFAIIYAKKPSLSPPAFSGDFDVHSSWVVSSALFFGILTVLLLKLQKIEPTSEDLGADASKPLPLLIKIIDVIIDSLPFTMWDVTDPDTLLKKGAHWAGLPENYSPDVVVAIEKLCLSLHRLLALAPESLSLALWEHFYPIPPKKGFDIRRLSLIIQFKFWKYFANRFGLDSVHFVRPDLPDECTFSLRLAGASHLFWSMAPVYDYFDWLANETDMEESYKTYRLVLQMMQAQNPHKRFVLKCPSHALNLETLVKIIPEACIVFTHRNPRALLGSEASLIVRLQSASAKTPIDWRRTAKVNAGKAFGYSQRMVKFASQVPAPKIFHAPYSKLVKEPEALVEDIHHFYDIEMKQSHQECLSNYLSRNKQHSYGKHRYLTTNTGMTELEIRKGLGDYIAYFGKYLPQEVRVVEEQQKKSNQCDVIVAGAGKPGLVATNHIPEEQPTSKVLALESNNRIDALAKRDIIYLTGASGFVGQMIVQKCESNPSISKVYCPIRDKRAVSGSERFQALFGACKKATFISPEHPVPRDTTLVILNAYCVKFFTPVENFVSESIKPMIEILDQITRDKKCGVSKVRGISVVSTAYVQPPLPFVRSTNDRVPFLLEGICTASDLYQNLLKGATTWQEVTQKYSEKLLPYQKKNCYASSKNIMEHLIFERFATLPICIVRPSIVAPSKDGLYGYDSRAGLPLFLNIAPHPIMMAPCSEGRLNLVFVEDVANDIVRAAQEIATPASAIDGISQVLHPILPSTSLNEYTAFEYFQKVAHYIPRVNLQNGILRDLVRAVEFLHVFVIFGKRRANLVSTLYKNYDMIMSEEFDFKGNHGPVVDETVRATHLYYKRQKLSKNQQAGPSMYHAVCYGIVVSMIGLVSAYFAPMTWKGMAFAAIFSLGFALLSFVQESGLAESPRFLRYFTLFFDYFWVSIGFLLFNMTCDAGTHDLVKIGIVAAGTQTMAVLRDGLYLKMFPNVIAKDKVEHVPGLKELRAAIKTWSGAMILLSILMVTGFIQFKKISSPNEVVVVVWVELAGNLLTTDYPFMYLFHGWMHRSAWAFLHLHKVHHESKKSCQAFDAFKFEVLDLFVENGLAPFAYLSIKALLGLPVHVQMASLAILAYQQINEHSCNPHTPIFLNPVLDYLFKVNIKHQLHHACCNQDDDVVIPFNHLCSSKRREDMKQYEKVFGVDLGYNLTAEDQREMGSK